MSAGDTAQPYGWRRVLFCLMGVLLSGCSMIVDAVDRWGNRVVPAASDASAPSDPAFHRGLFVADLHADTLLWNRDILFRSNFGHLDLPRLRDGSVSLQVFTVVTKDSLNRQIASGANPPLPTTPTHCVSGDDANFVSILNALELRPLDTWFDLEARALYQADRLNHFALRSQVGEIAGERLRILRTTGDLAAVVTAWRQHMPEVGAVLGLEGAHWLGDVATVHEAEMGVQRLFDKGFRLIALTHRFDNGLAGSSEGCTRAGLSPLGRAVFLKAQQLGMIVDLAHLSSPALQDAVRLATGPVIVSHTGAQGSCEPPCYIPRNLTDADIRAVARTGGIIGIGYWREAVGDGLESIVKAIGYVASVLSQREFIEERRRQDPGYDPSNHIALGSDFDGFVTTPIDASQLAQLTTAIRQHANASGITFSPKQVQKIAGGNACRVFAERLPGGSSSAATSICRGIAD